MADFAIRSGFCRELRALIFTLLSTYCVLCVEAPSKKKRSTEENEENYNLNIHKALCLFPPICVREKDHPIPLWILAITSHCNLAVSKVTPVALESQSQLNIIVGLEEDASRLDGVEADIILLVLSSSTPLHCVL